jgi:ribosome-binding factor A
MPTLEFHVDTGREDVQRIDAVLYEVAQELKAASDKPEG